MAKIEVAGKKYRVVETMRIPGIVAKYVETPEGERVAVKRGGRWTWWKAKHRLGIGDEGTEQ